MGTHPCINHPTSNSHNKYHQVPRVKEATIFHKHLHWFLGLISSFFLQSDLFLLSFLAASFQRSVFDPVTPVAQTWHTHTKMVRLTLHGFLRVCFSRANSHERYRQGSATSSQALTMDAYVVLWKARHVAVHKHPSLGSKWHVYSFTYLPKLNLRLLKLFILQSCYGFIFIHVS